MMNKVGIMQGRLLSPVEGKLQAFPHTHWPSEFPLVKKAGLTNLEWIFDDQPMFENPISDTIGQSWLNDLQNEHGVNIGSICADFFMRYPLFDVDASSKATRLHALQNLIANASVIGAQHIVIPFVDNSSLRKTEDFKAAIEFLQIAAQYAIPHGVSLHLETDLGPNTFAQFLEDIGEDNVKVNYDSGNSAALGFNTYEEFDAYGELIGSVHIKDRLPRGSSVPLGEGAADFSALFSLLHRIDYKGNFILQTARGLWGHEMELTINNKMLIGEFWEKTTWIKN